MEKLELRFVICSTTVCDGRGEKQALKSGFIKEHSVIQAQEGFLSFGCKQMKFHREKSHEDATEMIWFNAKMGSGGAKGLPEDSHHHLPSGTGPEELKKP